MSDPVLNIWESLAVDEGNLLSVKNNFEYPRDKAYVKGTYKSPVHGREVKFMSFHIGMHTFAKDELYDSQPAVLTFYQVTNILWAYSMSNDGDLATFNRPLRCCEHMIEIADKLSKGETAEMRITVGDEPSIVQIKPFELVVN